VRRPTQAPGRREQELEVLDGRRGPKDEHAVRFKDLKDVIKDQRIANQRLEQIINNSGLPSLREKLRSVRAFLYDTLTYVDNEVSLAQADAASARAELQALIDAQGVTIVGIQSDVAGNTAAISTEAAARADADTALSGQITTIIADVGDNAAAISAETVARTDADSALANDITSLTATVGVNTADITAEQIARVNADNAIASDITTLQTDLGAAEASITTAANAISTLEGYAAATYTFRVKAGTAGAGIELVAADDPVNGAQSAVRISGDDILLDGSVLTEHIDTDGLTANWLRSQYIEASKVLISGDGNLIPNGDLQIVDDNLHPAGWSASNGGGFTVNTSSANFSTASRYFVAPGISGSWYGEETENVMIPVRGGDQIRVSFDYNVINGPCDLYLQLIIVTNNGSTFLTTLQCDVVNAPAGFTVQKAEKVVTIPGNSSDARYIQKFRFIQKDGRGRMSNFSARLMNGVDLIVDGGISADFLQIDNITLDTDANGDLIVKGGGINTDNIAIDAVTHFSSDSANASTFEAIAFCPVGSDIITVLHFDWTASNSTGSDVECTLVVNGTARNSGKTFVNAGADGSTTVVWSSVSGGSSNHTLTAGVSIGSGSVSATVNGFIMARQR